METLPVPIAGPSAYERKALREIDLWKNPDMGWFGRAVERVNGVMNEATELVRKVPGVGWTIDTLVAGLLRLTNEIVQDTVWRDPVFGAYRQAGHDVHHLNDIRGLDLEAVDAVMAGVAGKYRALAAVEGAATGYAGLPGIAPDLVALVALNLRAAGEYATYCGFDMKRDEERLFALEILSAVSSPSDASKQVALSPFIRVSQKIARDQAWQAVEQAALTRAIRNATHALGLRLTRAKLAQIIPVSGAVIASGFNAYYTSKVCDTAALLYRERFLVKKYGEARLRLSLTE